MKMAAEMNKRQADFILVKAAYICGIFKIYLNTLYLLLYSHNIKKLDEKQKV